MMRRAFIGISLRALLSCGRSPAAKPAAPVSSARARRAGARPSGAAAAALSGGNVRDLARYVRVGTPVTIVHEWPN